MKKYLKMIRFLQLVSFTKRYICHRKSCVGRDKCVWFNSPKDWEASYKHKASYVSGATNHLFLVCFERHKQKSDIFCYYVDSNLVYRMKRLLREIRRYEDER